MNKATQEFLTGIQNSLQTSIANSQTSCDEQFAKFSKRLGKLENDLSDVKNKLEKQEPHLEKTGIMFEMMLRQELRGTHGASYARPFVVNDLYGLARLVAPKDIKFIDGACTACSEGESTVLLASRVSILVGKAFDNVSKLRAWVNKERKKKYENDRRKLKELIGQLSAYDNLRNKKEKMNHLHTSKLGLWALTAEMYVGGSDFTSQLQFDIRGSVELRGNRLHISCAEVKCGSGKQDAIDQLCKRICAMNVACQLILPDNFCTSFHGEIFTPRENWLHDRQPTEAYILERMDHMNLIHVQDVSMTINVVR